MLLCGGADRPYGEPRYLPIFEAAAECGLPVAIHSGGEGMGIAAPPGGAGPVTFYIEWHTLGSAAASCPPRLAHLPRHLRATADPEGASDRGRYRLAARDPVALDTNWRALRSETPWLERKPSEVAREHVRLLTQPLEHADGHDETLFEMLEAAGAPDNLCFASDYPHWDFDDPGFMLKRLPEAWRDKVLHENAVELYGERLGLDGREHLAGRRLGRGSRARRPCDRTC